MRTRQRIVFTIKCRRSSTYPCAHKVARSIYRSDDSPAPRLYSRCKSPRAGRVSSLFIINVIMPCESTTAWKPPRAAPSDHRGTQISNKQRIINRINMHFHQGLLLPVVSNQELFIECEPKQPTVSGTVPLCDITGGDNTSFKLGVGLSARRGQCGFCVSPSMDSGQVCWAGDQSQPGQEGALSQLHVEK